MIKVDFNTVKENNHPVPEGTYTAEILNVELKSSKNNRNQYLNWHLKIIHEDSLLNEKKLFLITSLKETCLWRLKKLLKTLNYPCNGDIVEIDPKKIIGCELKVIVIQERYNGNLYNKIIEFHKAE